MGLRRPKSSIDIDDSITVAILDNGDLMVDNVHGEPISDELLVAAVEERIDSLTAHLQRLHFIRDMTKMRNRVNETEPKAVNPFYNLISDGGPCADCDRPICKRVVSQWGKTKDGDLVCIQCERNREYEYGLIPPSD